MPGGSVGGVFYAEAADALPFADVFHEGDVADGLGFVPAEGDGGGCFAVVGCPISVFVAVIEVAGGVFAVGSGGTGA